MGASFSDQARGAIMDWWQVAQWTFVIVVSVGLILGIFFVLISLPGRNP